MATISEVRTGLATALSTINKLRVSAQWPDTVNPPAAIIKPIMGAYHETMGSPGLAYVDFEVFILAASLENGLARGQQALDPYLDPSGSQSVKAAIEADITLGGKAQTLIVTGWRDYGALAIGTVEYVGARLEVRVWPV